MTTRSKNYRKPSSAMIRRKIEKICGKRRYPKTAIDVLRQMVDRRVSQAFQDLLLYGVAVMSIPRKDPLNIFINKKG